jgi:Ran GTPase-activating protein (RanGAP) involved in mRNA processing and transport
MLRYKFEHRDNQWTNDLKKLKDQTIAIEGLVDKMIDQLNKDHENSKKNLSVSDCALYAPRLDSSLDKKYMIAKRIAFKLFPTNELNKDPVVMRRWTYIRYQQLLSLLTKIFKEQIEKEETLKNRYKDVRKTHQRKYFCELKKQPLSNLITHPIPMPVNISSLEELQPFFDHLKNNDAIMGNKLQFDRGIHYDDGRMDLCKQVVGPPHIGVLMESLRNNSQIEHFLLGNNIIGYAGAKAISDFIKGEHLPKIKTWYLAGNEINDEGIKLIADALKYNTHCEALWLKRNPIKAIGVKYLAELLEVNNHIRILDLHNIAMLDEGCQTLFTSLKKNTGLRHLYVDANGITVEGVKSICQYFDYLVQENRKGITSLWIDINRIDDEGTILLSHSLKNYKYLKRLVMGSNRITEVGTQAVCDALVNSSTLEVLDLGLYKSTSDLSELPNNFGDAGAQHIAEFIEKNKSVKVMSVLHNNISEKGLEMINDALQKNDHLLYIYYEQYGINIPQALKQSMKNKLSQNIERTYHMEFSEFMKDKLRYIRGSEKLKNIDSDYRNKM